jgi:hypothetical protein
MKMEDGTSDYIDYKQLIKDWTDCADVKKCKDVWYFIEAMEKKVIRCWCCGECNVGFGDNKKEEK